jgi:hypothetical protein
MSLLRTYRLDAAQTDFNNDQESSDCIEAHKFNKRGLFIGGCQKSGTTLLMSLLDGHPQLVVLPEETHYLEERAKYLKRKSYQARLEILLESLGVMGSRTAFYDTSPACAPDVRHYGQFDFERFAGLASGFVSQPWMNDSLLLSETIRAYGIVLGANWRNCAHWVEKTTKTETYAHLFDRLFPDAQLIQVVRDPRAVFASLKNRIVKRYGSHSKAHRLLRSWNSSARQIPRLRKEPSRFLVIRYEDLVKSPREILETICRFGGFEFNERLLKPTRAGNGWLGNSTFYQTLEGISAAPTEHWKDCLTEDEIWWVELHCRMGMQLAGYAFQSDTSFSLMRWLKRLPGESWFGYFRARRASLCQGLGLLMDCRYGG